MQTTETILPQVVIKETDQAKNKIKLLSPFTWTNIKLPILKSQVPINQHNSIIRHHQSVHHEQKKKQIIVTKNQQAKKKTIKNKETFHERKSIELKKDLISINLIKKNENLEGYIQKQIKRRDCLIHRGKIHWSKDNYKPRIIKNGQYYNHIEGSHFLTIKNKLHQNQSAINSQYYPMSMLLPQQYNYFVHCYDANAIKIVLKKIVQQFNSFLPNIELEQVCASSIKQLINIQESNSQVNLLIKMCLFFEVYRKQNYYNEYFEKFEKYKILNFNYNQVFFHPLIKYCEQYTGNKKALDLNFQAIQYKILILLLHYDKMLKKYEDDYYHQLDIHNLWIIKPIGSSKGAGITIVKNKQQFYSTNDALLHRKNQNKYLNKIIQKYIEKPLLLNKPEQFKGCKFDIRQWVLIVSGESQNKVRIYKYYTAYCRFTNREYTVQQTDLHLHLTNYSINWKKNGHHKKSVLMLEQMFESIELLQLRQKYKKQSNKIIYQTITSTKQLKVKDGEFELLGYDLMFDQQGKLWLLQINLNPSCEYNRDDKLKSQVEKMVASMLDLILTKQLSSQWQLINNFTEQNLVNVVIKPFFQYQLTEKESILKSIKRRNIFLKEFNEIIYNSLIKYAWICINDYQYVNKEKEKDKEKEEGEENLVTTQLQKDQKYLNNQNQSIKQNFEMIQRGQNDFQMNITDSNKLLNKIPKQ